MTTPAAPTRPRKLVVGIDFSELSERALDVALDTAAVGDSTEIHALVVRPLAGDVLDPLTIPVPPQLGDDLEMLRDLLERRVRASLARYGSSRLSSAVAHASLGSPAHEIARLAAELDADLVIVGTHGRKGLGRFLLGSVAETTMRLCGCPVYVVRPKDHNRDDQPPKIEPPCPECVARRHETKGAELWCKRHSEHHPRAHVYSYAGPSMDAAKPWGFDRA